MKKILVIGCPGSGKSTFSRALCDTTEIPLHHLDLMYWNADRTFVDQSVFVQRLKDVLSKDEWIVDGNYASTLKLRLEMCDTVMFLDYSLDVCLQGIYDRVGKPRSDMPWIEDEVDEEFLELVRNFNSLTKPKMTKLLNQSSNKKIYVFKNRNEADQFLQQLSFRKGDQ